MARGQLEPILRHLRELGGPQAAADLSDGELLRCFASRREEGAFATLLQRHGPLVLSVCRRVLRHEQDAEDAFQATFLVLAHRASSIRRQESLASWLYRVAHRTALKARIGAAKGRAAGRERTSFAQPGPPAEASLRELQRLLENEVSQLPEKYRAPFVLCCLEGHSRAEAARQLGWNEGTLSSRLALARERLRQRLLRRGVALAAALSAVALGPSANAVAPAALAAATVEAVGRFLAGKAAGAGSVQAVALAEGVLRAMSLTRWKVATMFLVILAVAGAGVGVATLGALAGKPTAEERSLAQPAAPERDTPRADRYGDPLPPGALARMGTVRFRDRGGSSRVLFLPGDRALVTAGCPTCSFWDVASGKEVRRFDGTSVGWAHGVSPDGKTLAGTIPDNIIQLSDAVTGKPLRQLKGHAEALRSVAFAANGRTLVSGGQDGTVRVWDTATGKEARRFSDGHLVMAVAAAPDGKTVVSVDFASASTVRLREVASGKEVRRFQGQMPIFQVVFSPDGKTVAALEPANGGVTENKVHLWDLQTGKVRQLSAGTEYVWSAAFSPDSGTLATGHQDTFHLWDVASGSRLARFEGKRCPTGGVGFSRDGKTLATSGDSALRLWEVATGKEVPAAADGHQGMVAALAFLHDGKTLLTAGRDGTLRHWETATGKELLRLPGIQGPDGGCCFAAEAKVLAFRGDREVRLSATSTGKELHRFSFPGDVWHLALTPDGKTLAVSVADRTLRIVDTVTGKERFKLPPYVEMIAGMAFSPGGDLLAVGLEDNTFRLVDVTTGEEVRRIQTSGIVAALAFSPDGRTLATIDEHHVQLWETASGKERVQFPDQPPGAEMIFSADGRILVLTDDHGALRLCLAATGKELRRLQGHRGSRVTCLAISTDGKTLASGSWDTSALVWDISLVLARKGDTPGELDPRQMEALWTALAGDDAARAYGAINSLAAAPGQAVAFLGARLRPVSVVEPRQTTRLLADLDSDDFAVREKAATELEKLGESAEPALRKALETKPSPEVRRRVGVILQKLQKASPGPQRLRELRALEVLEQIGGTEVRQLLRRLAEGLPQARLTQEARNTLERLERRSR
jgi:RNA polymerase sigma factor (sigma-70 family)